MKNYPGTKNIILMLIAMVTLMLPISAGADGYSIVDRDGNIISEDSKKIVSVSASEKRVVFRDKADHTVFDVEWDASNKKIIVKGGNIYLRIYSTGKVEKLMSINENDHEKDQSPVTIQPVVPIFPGQKPQKKK
jgi:hypothetical protein